MPIPAATPFAARLVLDAAVKIKLYENSLPD